MVEIEEKQKQRFLFLNTLYSLVDGKQESPINMYEIGKSIALDFETINTIVGYLEGEGLVNSTGFGGTIAGWVAITHKGVREVEQAHYQPNIPTSKFPANIVNNVYYGDIIKTGSISGKGIVIGKQNTIHDINIDMVNKTLTTINNKYSNDLKDFVQRIQEEITTRKIPEEQAKPIFASIDLLTKEIANLTPLAPISKLIGKTVKEIVDSIKE